jgi:hypothetical protein
MKAEYAGFAGGGLSLKKRKSVAVVKDQTLQKNNKHSCVHLINLAS